MADPLILVSNDDGVNAEGIKSLAKSMAPLGRVVVVAPATDQSTVSHAMSLRRPLRLTKEPDIKTDFGDIEVYGVDGTPTDSVYMAINHILKNETVDMVVSGINHGANLGNDVHYSGTVSAAMEGAMLKIPAIAFSLVSNHTHDFAAASNFAADLCKSLLKNPLEEGLLLNVNIPKITTQKDFAVTVLGEHGYDRVVEHRLDTRDYPYFWIGGKWSGYKDLEGTDCKAIADGYISVTPLEVNLTKHNILPQIEKLQLENYAATAHYLGAK